MNQALFCFDLDGTITEEEIFPYLAGKMGKKEYMYKLTQQAILGELDYVESLFIRLALLEQLSVSEIHEHVQSIPCNADILHFIQQNIKNCCVITSNLEHWLQPLQKRYSWALYASRSKNLSSNKVLVQPISKAQQISNLKKRFSPVIAIGDACNDIPMFQEADMSIGYTGVNNTSALIAKYVDRIATSGEELCDLLEAILNSGHQESIEKTK